MKRTLSIFPLFAALIVPAALAATLPSGTYRTPEGGGAMVQATAQGWIVSDPYTPGFQIKGDYRGQCQLQAQGQTIPCQAQVGPQNLTISVPALNTTLQLQYAGQGGMVAPQYPAYSFPSPVHSG